MRIEMYREDAEQFLKGVQTYERCGVMYGTSRPDRVMMSVVHIEEVPNRHPDRENRFRIHDSDTRVKWYWQGHKAVGAVHTHPLGSSAEPSPGDYAGLGESHYGAVIHPPTKRITFFDSNGVIATMKIKDLPSRGTKPMPKPARSMYA